MDRCKITGSLTCHWRGNTLVQQFQIRAVQHWGAAGVGKEDVMTRTSRCCNRNSAQVQGHTDMHSMSMACVTS